MGRQDSGNGGAGIIPNGNVGGASVCAGSRNHTQG